MADTIKSNINLSHPLKLRRSSFLSYIVFEAPEIRIGLEITATVFLFSIATNILQINGAVGLSNSTNLLVWLTCCLTVAGVDQFFLCKPLFTFSKALEKDLEGDHEQALNTLELIKPNSSAYINCTPILYHLTKARFLGNVGRICEAEKELTMARICGAEQEEIYLVRSDILYGNGNFDGANCDLEHATSSLGETSRVLLLKALIALRSRSGAFEAKQMLNKVLSLPNTMHQSGASTHLLALSYLDICNLWTGRAEAGLDGLDLSIKQLLKLIPRLQSLKPIISFLLVERAYYHATHNNKKQAQKDLNQAIKLCRHKAIIRKAKLVESEISS